LKERENFKKESIDETTIKIVGKLKGKREREEQTVEMRVAKR